MVKQSMRRARPAWAICALILLVGQLGVSAEASSSQPVAYPSTSKAVCEESYGGSFTPSMDSSKCLVQSDSGASTLYAGFGADGFDWVQTTKFSPVASSGQVHLGPASVGCSNPDTDASAAWALDCI
ncbi:MAG: hypothetical protein WD627_01095 [Actinomycetota bacterium]